MRRNFWYLITTVVLIVGTFLATVIGNNTPVLGLDLQGGIEVRLQPVGKARATGVLDKAVDIIRNRVNGLGVAETEVKRDGQLIVVDLPGVKDRRKAQRLVGKTAELRFRPVLAAGIPDVPKATPSKKKSSSSSSSTSSTSSSTSSTTSAPATGSPGKSIGLPSAATSSTTVTTATTAPTAITTPAPAPTPITTPAPTQTLPATSTPEQDKRGATVILPGRTAAEGRYQLGPTALTGRLVTGADARFASGNGWTVVLTFNSTGSAKFNALAAASFSKASPQNQVAIVLDGVVQSAPAFRTSSFDGNVEISGKFSQTEAEDLATVLRFGSLPVQLKELTTTSVSPTLGRDQLDAGLLAGIVGLVLVALYMIVFYRILGLVVIAGLMLAGMAVYTMITFLGDAIGLTLTLAGVVGLIVSVGITVDSYIVYFERLKDEVRTGRTVRSSVDRGFTKSFRTILAADLVSLIAAAILYWRAIGSVRQFAFLLGLSTILDLLISYFFMHPMVQLLAQRASLVRAKKVGIAAGLDTPEVAA